MSTDVFSIHCDALDGARLAGFKGTEVLSRPFEVDLFFTVPAGTDVKGAVGARATLKADRGDGRGPMCWHGILAGVRLLHETAERALYRASLVPRLWVLGHHVRSYVHTKKKVDAFAADTLKDGGLSGGDFDFKANGSAYPEEEFVCQYRESHLDFVHRWFEREGLYYYFEHGEGEGGSEKLLIVDDRAQHGPLLGDGHVRYFPAAGADASAGECLRELHADFRLLPASVLVSDYNYANPAAPVAGEKPVSSAGRGKIREYGYRVFNEGEAKRLAQVKAQSIACRELVLSASGTYLGLRAGYTFEVGEGPSDLPSKYLAIEVRHAGAVSGASPLVMRYTGLDPKETYRVDVVAIPADVQYRAPQSTAWPRIYGFENGTVDGPADSDYAQIDDHGRYLVRFKFDTSDLPDGSTSTYLRMMQPHGGSPEGWHFPLRKDTEVMVSFQGGDPDRPVIAGVVPNAVTPSPVTRKNHTQNVVRTGGQNFMVMDDTVDRQYIDIYTPGAKTHFYMGEPEPDPHFIGPPNPNWPPRTAVIPALEPGKDANGAFSFSYFMETDDSAGFNVGGDWWQHVGSALFVDVVGEGRTRFGGRYTLLIGGESNEHYGNVRNTTITSGRSDKVLGGGMTQEINGGYLQKITPAGKQEVTGDWFHRVGGEAHDKYGTWTTEVDSKWTANIGGPWDAVAAGTISITSTGGAMKLGATGGSVSVFSPVEISLTAPSIKNQAPERFNIFGKNNAAGVEQFTATSFTGQYTSGVNYSLSGINLSLARVAISAATFSESNPGAHLDKPSLKVASAAAWICSLGMCKL